MVVDFCSDVRLADRNAVEKRRGGEKEWIKN